VIICGTVRVAMANCLAATSPKAVCFFISSAIMVVLINPTEDMNIFY
jgi:hypothetical protein